MSNKMELKTSFSDPFLHVVSGPAETALAEVRSFCIQKLNIADEKLKISELEPGAWRCLVASSRWENYLAADSMTDAYGFTEDTVRKVIDGVMQLHPMDRMAYGMFTERLLRACLSGKADKNLIELADNIDWSKAYRPTYKDEEEDEPGD